mmetsp:Transcript_22268/g.30505  ORF Transcript_22268/g.30505 Transcript_22268/m.30505 type:complete len:527 (+) Transcript_22268:32-1612(+)
MVVLSVAICTKGGKTLLARQFVEMTRIRIEGLLAAFPKLMSSDAKQQHTFVETDSVRYVYQPIDNLYLLLITNRASNIVEDLETLRLLSKVVPNITGTTSTLPEEKILEKSFDILFAFDEVITFGGYREPITLQQIRTNMEMESHEEKLHNMIKTSKIESAKDQARDAAKIIREKQREMQKSGQSMSGIGSSSAVESPPPHTPSYSEPLPAAPSPLPVAASRAAQPVKGMSLMGGTKNKSLEDALVKEDKLAPVLHTTAKSSSNSAGESAVASYVTPLVQHPVMMVIAEKVQAKLTRDGLIEMFEIKGSLTLTAANDAAALCSVQLKPLDAANANSGFRFNTHPNVNKTLYEKSNLLQLKDASKGFPSARPVGILKWTYSSTSNDEMIPIKINCWPEEEARGQMNVSIEYNMDLTTIELHDVRIRIPLGTADPPTVLSAVGSHKHLASSGELLWELALIDPSNSTGSLEFSIQQRNADAFFPISVAFSSKQLYCSVDVAAVRGLTDGAPIQYGLSKGLSSEEYTIG